MPLNLHKVQKKITKKKGRITSLHENSRDAQKLRRASARSEKLEKLSTARSKANEPLLQRISFFQGAAKAATGPISVEKTHNLIQSYLARDEEELSQLKAERRPGRPSSNREDLLKQRMQTEEREFNAGYWIPDLQDDKSLAALREWSGDWENLNTLKFVRLAKGGRKTESSFPPKGQS